MIKLYTLINIEQLLLPLIVSNEIQIKNRYTDYSKGIIC